MKDEKLITLITGSGSLTSDEKNEIIENVHLFSDEDKQFLEHLFGHEQEEIKDIMTNHFTQEEKIIVQYLKNVLKLYDAEQLLHIKDRIHDLLQKENKEADIQEAEKLLESL